ncbi:MAG: molybdopterin molybdotransferase MoeA [Proteobacteria bacterium]|nr:molybdopterin molybdotransferase MoeA [Pseudomonadota bacterium]
MRGFSERADVEDVERLLASDLRPLEPETVPVGGCAGRVLAEDVAARHDVPGFRRAAMDGFALRGEATFGASEYAPLRFEVVGEAFPGRPHPESLEAGQAIRIMTGAPVPDGADAVVKAEVCREARGRVEVQEPVAPRKNVGEVGEDIRVGTTVLRRGRRLRPQDAGLLASIGHAQVSCVRAPRVALVVTGDELLPAGSAPRDCRIVDSNSTVLAALVARDGGVLLPFEILPDDPERIRAALQADADVLLVSGGSSVGQEDHAPRLLAELGRLDFHGVTMRPSGPAGGGRIGESYVFLLPGNPVSCLCAYEFFAGPTLRALGGRPRAWPHRRRRARLARKLSSQVGRTDYVRVELRGGEVVPIATSGASILSSTVRASGAVIVPRELEGLPEGAEVEVLLYDEDSEPGEAGGDGP